MAVRIHYLQHVPFEDPAAVTDWANEHGHPMTGTRVYENQPLPAIDAFDLLVVMGGPMSVGDVDPHPWLVDEKRFIRATIDAGRSVVGICLGAQLIADALGATVYPHTQKEIGWFDVTLTEAGRASGLFAGLPDTFIAYHWHGDTFDLPEGAAHLAQTDACVNQAFSYEGRVLGLQFHLETTPASADRLIHHCAHELVDAPGIQSAEQMRSNTAAYDRLAPLIRTVLDNLARRFSTPRA